DVNYAVRSFPGYGKLSGKVLDDLRAGNRVAVADGKRDPFDFVLWKQAKPNEPEDSIWDSPFGPGRPGWHIECSAMSRELLGQPLDIHGGGPDLKFPHHENEIAQSEGAYGGTLANWWMHCGPLMVDDEKMSKSLGNFRTIRDTVSSAPDSALAEYQVNTREAEMLRFFVVRNHYRSPQNFTPDNLYNAQAALDRIYQTFNNTGVTDTASIDWSLDFEQAFKAAMDDDFNTAVAIAVLFDMVTEANRHNSATLSGRIRALGGVLGLLQQDPQHYLQSPTRYIKREGQAVAASALSESEIEALIEQRRQAKQDRDFGKADQIRAQLKEQGVELEDKPGGLTQWRRA